MIKINKLKVLVLIIYRLQMKIQIIYNKVLIIVFNLINKAACKNQ